jgi:hypothetical protein
MKKLLVLTLLVVTAKSYAQMAEKGDTINFCFIKYKIPAGCKAVSEYQVKCDDYSMSWIYLTPQNFQSTPDQIISQLSAQTKKFKKEPVTCYLLNNQVKGYRLSFKTDQGISHQLMAWGLANEQLVLVQLSLNKEPQTDGDIPSFPGQIIRFSK